VVGPDQVLSALNGKDDVDINLRVGIGHAQKMPLLTELGNLFSDVATNMPALTGLRIFNWSLKKICSFLEVTPSVAPQERHVCRIKTN
jgi:hypothetical protein